MKYWGKEVVVLVCWCVDDDVNAGAALVGDGDSYVE